jgi:hypothetical protein
MDSDGQHEPASVRRALESLQSGSFDLVIGSRFHPEASILGLSGRRETGSTWANRVARFSLPRIYAPLTDLMSGFLAVRLDAVLPLVRRVDVNGFKFLYELLAVSRGGCGCGRFRSRSSPAPGEPRSSMWRSSGIS